MNVPGLIKTSLVIAGTFVIRFIAGVRVEKRKQIAMREPLMDAILLETVFASRDPSDDLDLLAEIRDTLAHLNRRAYAEEFWGLDRQLLELRAKLDEPRQATMNRALLRMLNSEDKWLQIVAAKTCAALPLPGAVPRLKELIEQSGASGPDSKRFAGVLAESLRELEK